MRKTVGSYATKATGELLAQVQAMVENSTAVEARSFDSAKWLGQWIERPLPALGGRKPIDMLDSSEGLDVVKRLLGSTESGAYQ